MKKSFIYLFAAAAVLASCAKPELTPSEPEVNVPEGSFAASFVAPISTKTSFATGTYDVLWNADDIICIKGDSDAAPVAYMIDQLSSDRSNAYFIPVVEGTCAQGSSFEAIYGDTTLAYQDGKISSLPMRATCDDSHILNFVNTCAVLEVNGISGDFKVTCKCRPYINNGESKDYVVEGVDGIAYVAVPTGEYMITLTQTVGGKTTKMTTKDYVLVETNTIYPLFFGEVKDIDVDHLSLSLSDVEKNVNVVVRPGDYTGKTITITDYASTAKNIYINVGGYTVPELIVTAPKAHVEVFNGTAVAAQTITSANTLVLKSDFSVQTLTVKGGAVEVSAKKKTETETVPNVETIIVAAPEPEDNLPEGTEVAPVTITVESTTENSEEEKVEIVNETSTTVVVLGTYNEVKHSENVELTLPVATIGDKSYPTLASAVAAAQAGETVTVLSDCEGDGIIVPSNSNLTVDFGGHTYTVNTAVLAGSNGTKTQCFQLLRDSKVTFKNGNIEADNSGIKMIIQNYADLTLEKMTLDATKGDNNVKYVLSNNNGDIKIKDTSISAKENGVPFDLYYWPSAKYGDIKVAVSGESSINGKVELAGEGNDFMDHLTLTFTFDPKNCLPDGYTATENNGVWTVVKAQAPAGITSQEEFVTACANAISGDTIVLGEGKFAIGPVDINGKTLTFKGQGAAKTTVYIGNGGYDGNGGHGSSKTANMTFEDVTLDDLASNAGYLTGFTEAAGLTFRNVTFNVGFSNWGNKGGDVSFYNCTFNQNTDGKYNVQELRSANNTHYLFDGCIFNSAPGRFINAYKQGGAETFIEIIVKDCSFKGTNQSKAALNLKSGYSDGCNITLYLLGNNKTNNVKAGSKTGAALFDDNDAHATVYQGATKEGATLIWENGAAKVN